jgi:hypothetical protein
LPDELSGADNNEEMEVLFAAAPLVLRRGCGDSALPIAEVGAGVDAVDDGIEEGLE